MVKLKLAIFNFKPLCECFQGARTHISARSFSLTSPISLLSQILESGGCAVPAQAPASEKCVCKQNLFHRPRKQDVSLRKRKKICSAVGETWSSENTS